MQDFVEQVEGAADMLRRRLDWLTRTSQDATYADVLRQTLAQTLGTLGDLGAQAFAAMAHRAGPGDTLRLAQVGGIPTGMARAWDALDRSAGMAPARATARRETVWSRHWPGDSSPPAGVTGALSAPLTGPDGIPIGALTAWLGTEPTDVARRALWALADTASTLLREVRHPLCGDLPWTGEAGGQREMRSITGVGMWQWHMDSGLLIVDPVTETLLPLAGIDPNRWSRTIEEWMDRIHDDDRDGVTKAIDASATDPQVPFAVRYRVVDEEGRVSWLELRALFDRNAKGEPVLMAGTVWDVTDEMQHEAWRSVIMDDNPDPIVILDGDDRAVWTNRAGHTMAERTGIEPIGPAPWDALPQLREQGLPELVARVRLAPRASDTTTVRIQRAGDDVSYTVRAAEINGWINLQWLDITARAAAARSDAERAAALEILNDALGKALGTSDVVEAIVAHALPPLGADSIVMHDLTGPEPRLVGLTGHGREFIGELNELGWDQRLEAAALASGPQYIPSIGALADGWPQLVPLARSGGRRAWAALPLTVSGEVVGSAVFAWSQPHEFTANSRSLLGTVAVVAAQALRSAAAYEQAQRHAEQAQQHADLLKRELLPDPSLLPELAGIHAAVRYRTAPETARAGVGVGGHWYDLLPLPGGRVMAVVGQVVTSPNNGVSMGTLRQLILALAALDMPADDLLAHVNDRVHSLGHRLGGGAVTATCLVAIYDPTTGRCTLASAGHAPPVLMSPGQPPAAVDIAVGDPLGTARVPAEDTDLDLPADTVLLMAGGAALPADAGHHLADAATRYRDRTPPPAPERNQIPTRWLNGLCDAVTGQAAPGTDDLVLLALAAERLPDDHAREWRLPREPRSAKIARDHVTSTLAAWGRDELTDSLTLVISELMSNTVRYASGISTSDTDTTDTHIDIDIDAIHLADDDTANAAGTDAPADGIRLRLLNLAPGGGVVGEVYDGSSTAPRVRHAAIYDENGRGLFLVATEADGWGVRYTETGKCIWATVGTPPE